MNIYKRPLSNELNGMQAKGSPGIIISLFKS